MKVIQEIHTISSGEWVFIQPLPTPRYLAASAVVSGRIVLLGGLTTGETKLDSVLIHNHQTGWHRTNFQLPTGVHSQVSFSVEVKQTNNQVLGESHPLSAITEASQLQFDAKFMIIPFHL